MKALLLAGCALASAMLAACGPQLTASGAPGGTPTRLQKFEAAAGMSVAAYCSLPEITRQAIRNRLTNGLPVIVCTGDLLGAPQPAAAVRP